jgi:acetyltransferase-like isoleucine patch superfamily enzyme
MSAYRFLAASDHRAARAARAIYQRVPSVTLPAPGVLIKPVLWLFLAVRAVYYFGKRVLVCEPLLKAYCKQYGRRLRADVFIPWVQGRGDIVLGDDVLIDGKLNVRFAARFASRPVLAVGNGTTIGHNCAFTVGKRITIGRQCHVASDVWVFDASGHPTDPAQRLAGFPPADEHVKPVVLGDNVWVGRRCIIFPGVTIGAGSVVSAGSVVMGDVPPNTLVAGNPARRVAALRDPSIGSSPAPSV